LAEAHRIVTHVRDQVNVIGHDDKAAAEPVVPLWAIEQKRHEPLEGVLVIEHAGAAIYANRQQVGDVSVTVRPNAMQTAQTARGWFVGIGDAVWGHTAYISAD
jgi:hypothetical protein